MNMKCVFIFPAKFFWIKFSFREEFNNLLSQLYMYSYEKNQILMKLEFSQQIFEESTIVTFHEKRSAVAESFPTDRRTWISR